MNAEEKIQKVKLKIMHGNPFFAYLALYLKFKPDNPKQPELPPRIIMGVDINGNVTYNEEMVMEKEDPELIAIVLHELMHCSLLHLARAGNRTTLKWNIAADIATNCILYANGYKLPGDKGIYENNSITFNKKVITELNEKTAEELYDLLPDMPGFQFIDMHIYNKDEGEAAKEKVEDEWLNKVKEAYVYCKSTGTLPKGVERYVEELTTAKINWRELLRKYLTATIPTDFTWMKKSRKSYALKTYLPAVLKEKVDVCVAIDTSGSINNEELKEFMAEVINLAKAYQGAIDIRLLAHDSAIQNDELVNDASAENLQKIKLKGGGGTSHKVVLEYVKERVKDCKCLVMFTDAYSDIETIDLDKYPFQKIFAVTSDGNRGIDKILEGKAITIKITK